MDGGIITHERISESTYGGEMKIAHHKDTKALSFLEFGNSHLWRLECRLQPAETEVMAA